MIRLSPSHSSSTSRDEYNLNPRASESSMSLSWTMSKASLQFNDAREELEYISHAFRYASISVSLIALVQCISCVIVFIAFYHITDGTFPEKQVLLGSSIGFLLISGIGCGMHSYEKKHCVIHPNVKALYQESFVFYLIIVSLLGVRVSVGASSDLQHPAPMLVNTLVVMYGAAPASALVIGVRFLPFAGGMLCLVVGHHILLTAQENLLFSPSAVLSNDLFLCMYVAMVYVLEWNKRNMFANWKRQIDYNKKLLERERISKEKAENANVTKRNFLKYVFHEIRVPLNALSLASDEIVFNIKEILNKNAKFGDERNLTLKWSEMTQLRDDSVVVSRQSNQVIHIINDVLSMQKIEDGKFQLEFSPFSLKDMLSEVYDLFKDPLEISGIALTLDLENTLENSILGDKYRLMQVISNFVSNAGKFTPSGGTVLLKSERVGGSDLTEEIKISVTDSGIGISEENRKKLFNPYVQIDSGKTQSGKGTGLGLNISKNIVELHQGRIGLESTVGQGSTFYIVVPFEKCNLERKSSVSKSVSRSLHIEQNKDRFILIAEDSPPSRMMLQRILESAGYSVGTVNNGREAVNYVRRVREECTPLDLIISDQEMPEMNGSEAIEIIRSMGTRVPIIALTGNAFEEEKNSLVQAGADVFLSKPVSRKLLLKTVGDIFSGS